MTTTTRITGHTAINHAEAAGLLLNKYADPTEDGREGLTVEEAREVAAEDAGLIYVDVDAAQWAAKHAEAEGRADYLDRAQDVASGAEPASWAWPLVDADDAYINAVGTSAIERAVGASWEDIGDEWCAAFRRGYAAAHDEVEA